MDKQKCIKALLDNLYEVYLQEGTIEKYQSHIQWAFKEAINNMRCFFKNDSFSFKNSIDFFISSYNFLNRQYIPVYKGLTVFLISQIHRATEPYPVYLCSQSLYISL